MGLVDGSKHVYTVPESGKGRRWFQGKVSII